MRTTLDLDEPILRQLKVRAKREGKSLGRLASDLLATALSAGPGRETATPEDPFKRWVAKPMAARVDLSDREAIYTAMENPADTNARVADEDLK